MSKNRQSDSKVQRQVEEEIRKKLKLKYLKEHLLIKNNKKIQVEIDGYSNSPPVLCEIYVHIGKLKGGQFGKVLKDIIKLVLLKKKNKKYRKHKIRFIFTDSNAAEKFLPNSNSWLSECFKLFNVESKVFKLSTKLRKKVSKAMKQQKQ
ncbi:MAG: hypothetical protein NC914_01510 [Candidatus Omnitrophica bacterium]|nr:hypothetical protein [Candidatus Omnitrophota bacterium]